MSKDEIHSAAVSKRGAVRTLLNCGCPRRQSSHKTQFRLMASCAAPLLNLSSASLIRRRDPLPIEATELAGLSLALNASSNSSTSFATVLSRDALLKAVKTNSGCKLLRRQLPQLQMLLPDASAAASSGWRPSAYPFRTNAGTRRRPCRQPRAAARALRSVRRDAAALQPPPAGAVAAAASGVRARRAAKGTALAIPNWCHAVGACHGERWPQGGGGYTSVEAALGD